MLVVGDVVPLSFITTSAGSYVTATAVTLTIERPDGTLVTVSNPTTSGVGQYRATFATTQPGRHAYWWTATGPGARAESDVFNVAPLSSLALISLGDVKEHLNKTDDVDDEELRRWMGAATRVVERHVGEVAARRSFTELFTARRGARVRLDRKPVLSVTSLASADGLVVYDPNSLIIDGPRGLITVAAGPALSGYLRINYVAGYQVVPDNYLQAAAIIAAHLWETQRVQTVGRSPGFGNSEVNVTPSGLGYAIPNRAVELLGGRPPVFA